MNTAANPIDARHGFVADTAGMLAASLRYFKARASLFAIEAKEAGINYGIAAGLVVGALFVMVLAYIFLIISAVFGMGLLFENEHAWIVILAIIALIHIAAAVVMVLAARRRVRGHPFPESSKELTRDTQWLHHFAKKT